MYYFNKILDEDFQSAIDKTTAALKEEGFGVITEIDIKKTMQEKLDIDFRKYTILGACNPNFAHQALLKEDKIGTMLPCNIIVQETGNGRVEVAAVNPLESMKAVQNESLGEIASVVTHKLRGVIEKL
jgi:uncharacterized protein (DUF302 family)